MIKKYFEFINEDLNIDDIYHDIQDIMFCITDEFPKLVYYLEDSLQSSIIEEDCDSFIITLYEPSSDFQPVLYYLEPKIHKLINEVSGKLKQYDLEVFYSDFGHNDTFYEIVVTKVGHKPRFNNTRYDEYGNPKGE